MQNQLVKKIASVGLSVTTAVWLSGATLLVPVVSAQSVADLQAQISALLAQITALQAQLNTAGGAAVAPAYNFTRDLTLGSTGADVKALQQWLNAMGYPVAASGVGSAGNETEYFGAKTAAALAKYQAAKGVSPAVGYFGPKTRASVAAAGSAPLVPGQPPVVVPGTGLVLSLASDNLPAQAVPRGATGLSFLKFNVAGSGTLDSLVFKRVGIGATADFGSSGFYLYEGNNRLTSGRSLNSTTHEVQFLSLNLTVSGVRTLTLVADVSSAATVGNRSAVQFVSGTGNPAPSGSLTGNEMTIAGQTVGGLAINDQAAPTAPKIGQVGALIQNIQLTASSSEDVMVNRLSITESGTLANSNLTNFVLKYAGNAVATAAAIGAKDLIVLNFTTPFLMEKGQQRTFQLYADVGGNARVDDTIDLYIDSASDVSATGKTYGYPVLPDINSFDAAAEGDVLTLQGGPVTMVFNGPVAGDAALRGQDVTLFDFTIAAQNNIEIKNLRFNVSTTDMDADEGFNDFKVWDVGLSSVLTSAVDITTSTGNQTFTDIINVNAGQTRRFKVTADVDSDNDAGDAIQVHLRAFVLGDVKNLDNNTNVALADIVSNGALSGNLQSVRAPTLTTGLSASPSSQTYVQGSNDKPLVGFSFQANGGDIRLDTVKITGASTTGPLTSGEVTNLALWDGTTRVSAVKSLDTSALTATFDSLNLTIPNGSTKLLTLRGNISVNATDADAYYFYIAAANTTDVTAYDVDGNTASYAGVNANSGNSVVITISTVGDVTMSTAATDNETKADIVLANGTYQTLGKFVFSAAREDMTVKKLSVMVNASSTSSSATSTTTGDEVPSITLWDGSTQIGGTFFPAVSGNSSSIVMIEGLSWVIPKDTNKTLTVKGLVNTIGNGADSGSTVAVHLLNTGFEAAGSSASDFSVSAASGNRKVVYKSKPTLSVVSPQPNTGNGSLSSGSAIKVLRFRVSADSNGAIGWRQAQFRVTLTNATLAAASTSNVVLRDLSTGDSLTLGTVYSSSLVGSGSTTAVLGSQSPGYVGLVVTTPQEISAGSSRDYDLELNFSELTGTVANDSQAIVAVYRDEAVLISATPYSYVANGTTTNDFAVNMSPSFVWTDRSVLGSIATSTADWANGVYVAPSLFTDVVNTLRD